LLQACNAERIREHPASRHRHLTEFLGTKNLE
jgi:hypothetical protein